MFALRQIAASRVDSFFLRDLLLDPNTRHQQLQVLTFLLRLVIKAARSHCRTLYSIAHFISFPHNVGPPVYTIQAGTRHSNNIYRRVALTRMQAASAIDTLKMSDSPAKKLDFSSANKENTYKPIVGIPDLEEEEVDEVEKKFHSVAPTIRPEEADEPILQENPQRFVLFPIKYHDVSHDAFDAFYHAS